MDWIVPLKLFVVGSKGTKNQDRATDPVLCCTRYSNARRDYTCLTEPKAMDFAPFISTKHRSHLGFETWSFEDRESGCCGV